LRISEQTVALQSRNEFSLYPDDPA
jgi:hypothetical protein